MFAALHEIEYIMPTIVCGFPSKPFIMITGKYPVGEYLNEKNIPDDIDIIRMPVPKNSRAGVLCLSEHVAKVDLYLPPNAVNQTILERALLATTIKTLQIQNLDVSIKNNDILIKSGNKLKKFFGMYKCSLANNWDFYTTNVSFRLDYNLMNNIYKLDEKKIQKGGKVNDMRDIVVGVDEFKSGIDREQFIDDYVSNLAKRFNWELEEGIFTDDEIKRIDDMIPILSSNSWVYNSKHYNSKVRQW